MWGWAAGGGAVLIAVIVVVVLLATGGTGKSVSVSPITGLGPLATRPSGKKGPEGVPIPVGAALAPAGWLTLGESRDGINCEPLESLAYHIHVHLTIYVNGVVRLIPYGIGIAPPRSVASTPDGGFVTNGSCFAWLHTHANDGVIHIESPKQKTYTLGDFFDIWGLQLQPSILGPVRGHITAFYNGSLYKGNPRDLPLNKHAQIQLDVGKPLIAPQKITFPAGL
jgi:hypothetical protein